MEQRQVIDTERAPSAIEMVAVIHANIAVNHITPRLEAPQLRLYHSPLESFEESQQGVSPVCAMLRASLRWLVLLAASNYATTGRLGNCAVRQVC
jgi:hypothetical protein